MWKYCFSLCFLTSQALLPFNAFSYKLPRFSHLKYTFLQQPSPTSSWVAFPYRNSLKLLLPLNSSLLPSLYSESASWRRKFPPVPEHFQWLKTSYMELWRERKKKNHQQNISVVRTGFSQNTAEHLLKKTIPHTLHFINKTISSLYCCPNRALPTCCGNTDTPWKIQENLNGQQGNKPSTLSLYLLIKH